MTVDLPTFVFFFNGKLVGKYTVSWIRHGLDLIDNKFHSKVCLTNDVLLT